MSKGVRVILASGSPRRKELLRQIGVEFQVHVSDVEEKAGTDEPCLLVQELSGQKAEAALRGLTGQKAEAALRGLTGQKAEAALRGLDERKAEAASRGPDVRGEGLLVIGADTVVACDGKILGKPQDPGQAAAMLGLLQGREHEVYTGVTLLYREAGTAGVVRKSFYEVTQVAFYPMSGEEIEEYAATGDPLDKAGAYGIQGMCARYISGIRGDYNNVVGLPVGRLYQEMKEYLV